MSRQDINNPGNTAPSLSYDPRLAAQINVARNTTKDKTIS